MKKQLKNNVIIVKLTDEERNRLELIAEDDFCNMSVMVRKLINKEYKNKENGGEE